MTARRILPPPGIGADGTTPWFPGYMAPAEDRSGLYQRLISGPQWAKWDGDQWLRAALTRKAADAMRVYSSHQHRYLWRGILLSHTLSSVHDSNPAPWNPGNDKPARANVYQRRLPDGSTCFAMWDLAHWFIGAPTIAQALKQRTISPLQSVAEWREIK